MGLRNMDTQEARKIWADVDKVAARAPEWVKRQVLGEASVGRNPRMSEPMPSIGRIVHYHWPVQAQPGDVGTAAAIITCVYPDGGCDLKIFFGPFHDGLLGDERHAVKQEPNRYGVYWSWPPRV